MNLVVQDTLMNELIQFRKVSVSVYDKFCMQEYHKQICDFSLEEVEEVKGCVKDLHSSLLNIRKGVSRHHDQLRKEILLFYIQNRLAKPISFEALKDQLKYSRELGMYVLPDHVKYKGQIYIVK